ncbi:uncharacterized protein B0I36DRAFT_365158 [Microdochium trichocladiopsis]|uniref:Heterokaryon incompatibility domain-containing protein n=1 Tax=Microdochium trichocladiopsis TaxID=1682393 RepID=A0A9P8Y2J4_9PEZI|nr:uncharacterized protein B0I36DRAFT_365158 [Microdochium trichocladiopsis]KAH7028037.1 hypothetical protein B0I36DRAFT_365158 [Microdochium trichocladiopsis]
MDNVHESPLAPTSGQRGPNALYTRLSTEAFRLVVVEQGSWTDPIQCWLRTVAFNSKQAYQALSYVWGTSISKSPISVDKHAVRITVNLELALKMLRKKNKDVVLWIDALCINQ